MDTEVYMGGVAKSKRFRWFIFAWLFGSLILRTAYRGDNISTVIVPPVSMNILTSFAQLRGFSLYTKASSTGRLQSRTEASLGTSVKSRAGMAFQKYLAWKYGLNVLKIIENDAKSNEGNYFGVKSRRDVTLIKLYKSKL
jgi:hypothetical protein